MLRTNAGATVHSTHLSSPLSLHLQVGVGVSHASQVRAKLAAPVSALSVNIHHSRPKGGVTYNQSHQLSTLNEHLSAARSWRLLLLIGARCEKARSAATEHADDAPLPSESKEATGLSDGPEHPAMTNNLILS